MHMLALGGTVDAEPENGLSLVGKAETHYAIIGTPDTDDPLLVVWDFHV
jgi:hypothetical protein